MNYLETVLIDDALSLRVLARLGRTTGEVRVASVGWDLGFCDTCSYEESGFAVYVDEALVWPNKESLYAFGGYIYADDQGEVRGNTLSTWGYLFDWLDGTPLYGIDERR